MNAVVKIFDKPAVKCDNELHQIAEGFEREIATAVAYCGHHALGQIAQLL